MFQILMYWTWRYQIFKLQILNHSTLTYTIFYFPTTYGLDYDAIISDRQKVIAGFFRYLFLHAMRRSLKKELCAFLRQQILFHSYRIYPSTCRMFAISSNKSPICSYTTLYSSHYEQTKMRLLEGKPKFLISFGVCWGGVEKSLTSSSSSKEI